jgi:N-acetylglucosamine malate deacetylase 1
MQPVLVIVAHADDEALGCGGTIAALSAQGRDVHALYLTDGVGARGTALDVQAAPRRRSAAEAAARVLGIKSTSFEDFPDNRMDTVPFLDIVQTVEREVKLVHPGIILTHLPDDLNVDHQLCHQAVLTACRPQAGHPVQTILGFEVASSTEWAFSTPAWTANYFVDISDHLSTKLASLACYEEEMRPPPHPRSLQAIKALAHWRGSTVGVTAAEAFSVIRQIVRLGSPS